MPGKVACCVGDATFCNLKAKYGGMTVSEVRRLKDLGVESATLQKLLAEAGLEKSALKYLLGRRW